VPVGLTGRSLSVRSLRAKPADGRHVSLFKSQASIFNGIKLFNAQSTKRLDAPEDMTERGQQASGRV
jgi:hypothetical protein